MSVAASPIIAAAEAAPDGHRFASFDVSPLAWGLFVCVIAGLLFSDLLLVHRSPHVISFKEAAIESAIWIALGLGFTLVMLAWQGSAAAGEYVTGYVRSASLWTTCSCGR